MEIENELATIIIGCAIKVHTVLGPGLLESAYEECLAFELRKKELEVKQQHPMPLKYESIKLNVGYRVDLIVENKIIIELKVVDAFNDVHLAQVLTYMKLSGCKLGLLLNFNVKQMKQGIKRIILTQ